MDGAPAQPVVLDATVLSNFASSDAIDWLVELLDRPVVVPAVRTELERGRDHGHRFLAEAIEPLGDDVPIVEERGNPTPSDPSEIRERLDTGEAESLVCTLTRDGTLATDDIAARRLAKSHGVPVTGSVGLLVAGVERGLLDIQMANEWLTIWRSQRGYYAPVDRMEEVLDR